jgi:hypothetical protein
MGIFVLALTADAFTNPLFASIGDGAPTDTPANNSVFFSEPEKQLSLTLYIFDADASNSPAGTIQISYSTTLLSWKNEPFISGEMDPINIQNAAAAWGNSSSAKVTFSPLGLSSNQVKVEITVLDSLGDSALQSTFFPYRRVCVTAKTNWIGGDVSDPGAQSGRSGRR